MASISSALQTLISELLAMYSDFEIPIMQNKKPIKKKTL